MDDEIFLRGFPHDNQDDKRLEKILLLQRLIRSYYVRRQFQEVRSQYLKTITEIEGETAIKSFEIVPKKEQPLPVPIPSASPSTKQVVTIRTRDELLRQREEIAIELLWLEQAIQSRKDYLRLKSRYTTCVS